MRAKTVGAVTGIFLLGVIGLATNLPGRVAAAGALVGSATVGVQVDGNVPGKAQDYRFTASASGTATTLHVYLDASNTADTVGLGLYASQDTTHAGRLLARCGIYGVPANVAGWYSCTMTVPVTVTAGTRYWAGDLPAGGYRGNDRVSQHHFRFGCPDVRVTELHVDFTGAG
jgi:hypothetical protein